ncbi:MAG: hypothetical protein C4343_06935, partial [Chloroflexota bacterium]
AVATALEPAPLPGSVAEPNDEAFPEPTPSTEPPAPAEPTPSTNAELASSGETDRGQLALFRNA